MICLYMLLYYPHSIVSIASLSAVYTSLINSLRYYSARWYFCFLSAQIKDAEMQELITVYEQEHAQKPQGERQLLDENASLRQKVSQQEMRLQTLEASKSK